MTDEKSEKRPKTARAQKGPSWLVERLPRVTRNRKRADE